MDLWSSIFEESVEFSGLASKVPNLIKVPLVYQADSYGCGAAALQCVLFFYGKETQYKDLEKELNTSPANGTDHRNILSYCEEYGIPCELRKSMSPIELEGLIDKGIPVIVDIQAWGNPQTEIGGWNNGHYAVCVGYDADNFYFMDPSTLGHYAYIPRDEFMGRWHDQDGKIKLIHAGIIIRGKRVYNPEEITKLQ